MGFLSTAKSFFSRKSWHGLVRSVLSDEQLDWSGTDFLSANELSLYTNKAVAKRAEKVGEIEFVAKRGDRKLESHPLLDLLYKPNSYMSGAEFWSLYQTYKDLTGSVFIWKEPSGEFSPSRTAPPKALHLLRPDLMRVIVKDGEVEQFEYTKPSGGVMTFAPDQITYSYYPDPKNPFFGTPLLKAGTRAIDTEVQISQYHSKILRNGGKIEGVFKFKTPFMNRQQVEDTRDSYDAQLAGAKKAGRPLFLGGDAEYQRVGLTPDELSYLEAKKMSLSDICILTGVPKPLLSSLDDVKFDNADAAMITFLRDTVRPLLRNLTHKLNEHFFPADLELSFVDPTPENVEQKLKSIATGMRYSFMTPNEARAELGMEPIEGGDELKSPPSAGTEQPDDENPPAPTGGEKRKSLEHPLKDAYIRKKHGELMTKRMDRLEEQFRVRIRKLFTDQEQRITTAVGGQRVFRKAGLIDETFDLSAEIDATKVATLGLIRQIVQQSGTDAIGIFSDQAFVMNVDILSWIDQRADVLGRQLTDTTFEKLKGEFAASLDAGESRQKLVKRIRDTYEGFHKTRAQTIARTEVHGAFQEGTIRGYKQGGAETKIWVAVQDSATRDAHYQESIDGEEVPIDQPFIVGGEALMYPGDPSGSARNTVNCRCTI